MDRLIRQCSRIIRKVAVLGNGTASVWYMYQPKKPKFDAF
ncbi:MAG: cyclic lactone autoinducer peptide [Ruminococcaceae bacterium]|nr:cyclic lactone autoinducer peptide [Oscillospiraceae bacterium]